MQILETVQISLCLTFVVLVLVFGVVGAIHFIDWLTAYQSEHVRSGVAFAFLFAFVFSVCLLMVSLGGIPAEVTNTTANSD